VADVKFEPVRTTIPTSGTTLDITISGFGNVQSAISISSCASTNDTQAADAEIQYGFLDRQGTPAEASVMMSSIDAQATSDTQRNRLSTDFINSITTSGAVDYQLSFNSWITDGVRLNIDTNPSTATLLTVIIIGGADVANNYAGEINLSTVTTKIDVTSPGFEPDLVLFASACLGATSDNNALISLGIAHNDGLDTQGCISLGDQNGAATTNFISIIRNNRILSEVGASSEAWNTTISDFDSSGFSVQSSVSTGSDRCIYLALKFNNNPGISLDFIDGPTSTGDHVITDVGFKPSFMLAFMSDNTSINTVDNNGPDGFAIYAADATNEYSMAYASQDNVGTSVCKSNNADSIHDFTGAAASSHVGSLSSFDNTGFTLNFTTAPGTARKWAVLTIGDVAVGAGGLGLTGVGI
jgi:hypothetical protein